MILNLQLFAFSDQAWMKIRLNINNDLVNVIAMFNSPMLDKENAKKRGIEPAFITHIVAKTNKKIVYEVSTSASISKVPLLKFMFNNNQNNKTIKFIITDNKGNVKTKSFPIKSFSSQKEKIYLDTIEKAPINRLKIWSFATPERAITEIYGKTNYIENGINIKLPSLSENLGSVPVTIQSSVDLESIAIFDNSNPSSTIAIFSIPQNGIINYSFRVKMRRICHINIIAVGKDRHGNIYKTEKELIWGGGDIQCTGYNTISSNGGGG